MFLILVLTNLFKDQRSKFEFQKIYFKTQNKTPETTNTNTQTIMKGHDDRVSDNISLANAFDHLGLDDIDPNISIFKMHYDLIFILFSIR